MHETRSMKTSAALSYPFRSRSVGKTELMLALSSVPVMASLIFGGMVGAVVAQPQSADLYAVLGAGLASICVLAEARAKGRSLWEMLSAFIGASAAGSFGPGILHGMLRWKGWLTPESDALLTWQYYAATGFFFAANGWWLIHQFNRRLRKRAVRLMDRYLPDDEKQ